MNSVIEIAKRHDRNYITPEDVDDALRDTPAEKVRLDVLEVLGEAAGYGAEDSGLCAFVAWKGEPDEGDPEQ